MRKILITGGAGFVGRHFTRHFLEAGDEVHVVDSIEQYTGGIDPAVGWPLFDPRDYAISGSKRSIAETISVVPAIRSMITRSISRRWSAAA